MVRRHHHVTLQVLAAQVETPRVTAFELASPEDWELPPFTAGAHIDLHLDNGTVRPYSLCGDPADSRRYRIAVQREDAGRGGSMAVHAQLVPGSLLSVSLPRNHFAVVEAADHHILIAGGIGITPFLSMIDLFQRDGTSFELHYCARTPEDMAFLPRMLQLKDNGEATLYFSRAEGGSRLDVAALMREAAAGAHIYGCGPDALIAEILEQERLRPEGTVHVESFGAKKAGGSGDPAYVVELAQSGREIEVETGQTMLEALRSAGVEIDASCEAGACLVCKTRYRGGVAVHRDLVMKADDRREWITPCVSGCSSGRIVLDL